DSPCPHDAHERRDSCTHAGGPVGSTGGSCWSSRVLGLPRVGLRYRRHYSSRWWLRHSITRAYAAIIVVKSPSREFALSLRQLMKVRCRSWWMTSHTEVDAGTCGTT